MFKKLFQAAITSVLILGICFSAAAQEKLKVGFVYVSPIGDAGWTYQHDLGRIALENAYPGQVETKYIENVPEGAEAERVIRDLAQSGHDLIFTTSFGYMNPTLKVARLFPKKFFEHSTGYKTAPNVGTYMCRFYEGRYLTGLVAGKMTKSNVLGYVAAFPIPEVIRGINAFTLGAQKNNPNVKVKVIWVNSWFDPGREREAAETLIVQGADVVTHHTDSTAPTLVAEEKGVFSVAYHSDMSKYGPKAHLTATMHVWDKYYSKVAGDVLAGNWKSNQVWGGIKEGMIKIAPLNKVVPLETKQQVNRIKAMIAFGKFHPFTGPILAQDGEIVAVDGKVLTDEQLLNMNYYVNGVQGQLPK
ncbi:MAG: BMP family ABC transporter substrate-binding protein [Proteobacteria bacterium]|nr:BMP family ABC transporter substrate-binding protein [Pseudomonadota bacterium]